MSSESRIRVATETEFGDGDHRLVDVNGVEVGVIKVDGEYYALRNECPHDHGPVCEGAVHRELVGDMQSLGKRVEQKYDDTPIVSCPWHGWPFRLETGEHIGDPSIKVPIYDVIVENGTVYVDST